MKYLKNLKRKGSAAGFTWVIGAVIVIVVVMAAMQVQFPVLNGIINATSLPEGSQLYAAQTTMTNGQVNAIGMENVILVVLVLSTVLGVLMTLTKTRSRE